MAQSGNRLNLADPRLAIPILITLAVVIAVNIRAFVPGLFESDEPTYQSTTQEMVVPDDLRQTVARASGMVTGASGTEMMNTNNSQSSKPARPVSKNPFRRNKSESVVKSQPVAATGTPTPKKKPLIVTGVMIGKRESVAWIDSQLCRVGDTFEGHRIESITEQGVWVKKGGIRRYLGVQPLNPDSTTYYYAGSPGGSSQQK